MRSTFVWMVTAALGVVACDGPQQPSDSAPQFEIISGDGQTGDTFTELPEPLVVHAHIDGQPDPYQVVNFVVVGGGGSVFAGAARTDQHGMAYEWWTLGVPGPQRLEVRSVHPQTGEKLVHAVFTATATGIPEITRVSTVNFTGCSAPGATVLVEVQFFTPR